MLFCFKNLGDTERAMLFIDKALDHTPTLIELLVLKAKIFKVCVLVRCTPFVTEFDFCCHIEHWVLCCMGYLSIWAALLPQRN